MIHVFAAVCAGVRVVVLVDAVLEAAADIDAIGVLVDVVGRVVGTRRAEQQGRAAAHR
jgi:hypothetical protein